LQFPVPSARRCYKLGLSLRKAIESYPEDLKVVIVATGGVSHQVHGERAGFNNTPWDMQFLDLVEKDPEKLAELTHADYARLGGLEELGGHHVADHARRAVGHGAQGPPDLLSALDDGHRHRHLRERGDCAMATDTKSAYLEHVGRQLTGVERLEGTYPFTLARSVKAYRLNKFLHDLGEQAAPGRFLRDPEAAFEEAGLTEEERALVRNRDWRGLIHYGVIFFMLEKLGAVVGVQTCTSTRRCAARRSKRFRRRATPR
jgi:gallate dioxygenase